MRAKFAGNVAILLAGMAPFASIAQLTPCQSLNTGSGYKIALDELVPTTTAARNDASMQLYMDRLRFKLQTKVESLRAEEEGISLSVIQCPDRRPRDGSEFDKTLVDRLNAQNVILEIWGMTDASILGGAVAYREARLGFVVVPVRQYLQTPSTMGLYFVSYPRERTEAAVSFLDLFDQSIEFDAYAAAGVGLKSRKVAQYDAAFKYLCKAQILLNQAMKIAGASSSLTTPHQRLAEEIKLATLETARAARADSTYKGALNLLKVSDTMCPTP